MFLCVINFTEASPGETFTSIVEEAELCFHQGQYQKTIELLEPFQIYTIDLPADQYYRALFLRGNSYLNMDQFVNGMTDFREINGMSVNQEPYPVYICSIFELLNDRYLEAKKFAGNLPFMREDIPNYYLVLKYLLALTENNAQNRITELNKIADNMRYRTQSSEFGKQLMDYFDGRIKNQQLLELIPPTMQFYGETYAIELLVALKIEKLDNTFNESRDQYFDVYKNSKGLYHWLAGKQLGLNYLSNTPMVFKEGKVQQHERNLKFEVSSSLYDEKQKHPIANIFDNNISTAWVEGKPGDGIGEWIKIGFEPDFELNQINIVNGYAKSKTIYEANNRLKKVKITFPDGKSEEYLLKDNVLDYQVLKLSKPVTTNSIKITIMEIYKGTKYNDTCISEIKFL